MPPGRMPAHSSAPPPPVRLGRGSSRRPAPSKAPVTFYEGPRVSAYPSALEEEGAVGRTTTEYPKTEGHRWGTGRSTSPADRKSHSNEEWEWKPEAGVMSQAQRKDPLCRPTDARRAEILREIARASK